MRSLPAPRAAALRRRLLRWFASAKRDLPWRFAPGREDPYRTWISEAMLQQTQVATVIPYYRRFLERFPTLSALAEAPEDEVLGAWAGLGYYARARAISRAAREALERHGGLPRGLDELRGLPGFGPYTAGAVASIAFGLPTPAVDGNAGRVLSRLFLVASDPHSRAFRDRVWGAAQALVDGAQRPGDLNQALIELGALVCRPGAPDCARCPLESPCEARRTGRQESLPRPRRRPARRVLHLAVGVLTWRGRVLLEQRPSSGLFAGMWSPPLVELGPAPDAAAALSVAIRREPSVRTGEFTPLGTVERELTHRRLRMSVVAAPLRRMPRRGGRLRLAHPEELGSLAVPTAVRVALALAENLPTISGPARRLRTASPKATSRLPGWGVGSRIERV